MDKLLFGAIQTPQYLYNAHTDLKEKEIYIYLNVKTRIPVLHSENTLLKKYPVVNKIIGFITLVLVFYCVWEWNNVTNSYWGFVYLVIALPGLFIPLVRAVRNGRHKTN